MNESEVPSARDASRPSERAPERSLAVSLDDMESHFRGLATSAARVSSDSVGVLDFATAGNIYGSENNIPAQFTLASAERSEERRRTPEQSPTAEQPRGFDRARTQILSDFRAMPSDAQAAVRQNLERIESPSRVPPLSPEQINRVYSAIGRLLSTNDGSSPLSLDQRRLLSMGILDNAANPRAIDQGRHDTCNVTTLEERLYTLNPSLGAELVAHVGLTGRYRAPDGRIAHLDPANVAPDSEGRIPPHTRQADGVRNYASQLFQLGVINDHWQRFEPAMRFTQVRPSGRTDTGDRLSVNGHVIANETRLDLAKMNEIGGRLGFQPGYIVGNARAADVHSGVVGVRSERELQQVLERSQGSSAWPMIIGVEGNHRMFGRLRVTEGETGHVVSIVGYDRNTRTVQISDQRGHASDLRRVPLSELYRATVPPRQQTPARPRH